MDLLITQGMWYASTRLAYQLAIATSITEAFGGQIPAKDAPNTAPSEIDLSRWADIDIKEIPQVLRAIEESWLNPLSISCQSARYLTHLFIEKAKYFEAKQIKMLQAGLQTQVGVSLSVDMLIIGVENSLWLGERFAQDLKTIFPFLQVSVISSNQVLKKLKHDFNSLCLGKRSLSKYLRLLRCLLLTRLL